ncbi:hypothetical protein OV079_20145 [Nannocystis pusilla]|uniref:Uncharacterized protein n=1 Tax=Nannocystis pusilla TaxID=889268 RepID=A0A9X3EPM0_9BACT|nr:hypothetical protein [Nannocystis pusilla]
MSELEALPAEERQEWLLEGLGALLRQADWQHFVCTPIVLPRPEFFPDRFTRSAAGVLRLVRRLFRYADLELGAEIELYEGRPPAPEGPVALGATHHHEGAAGLFLGIEAGVARFGADLALLDDPGGITATLAHEVAHAYRSHHALCVEDHDLEEELTDMTAVFLGFGVLSANAALRHTSEPIYDGTLRSRWSVQRLGYLSPQELCFLLAAQVHARGAGREAVLACLGTNQASYFRAALRRLERERPALASDLGLPPRELAAAGQRGDADAGAGRHARRARARRADRAGPAGEGVERGPPGVPRVATQPRRPGRAGAAGRDRRARRVRGGGDDPRGGDRRGAGGVGARGPPGRSPAPAVLLRARVSGAAEPRRGDVPGLRRDDRGGHRAPRGATGRGRGAAAAGGGMSGGDAMSRRTCLFKDV